MRRAVNSMSPYGITGDMGKFIFKLVLWFCGFVVFVFVHVSASQRSSHELTSVAIAELNLYYGPCMVVPHK